MLNWLNHPSLVIEPPVHLALQLIQKARLVRTQSELEQIWEELAELEEQSSWSLQVELELTIASAASRLALPQPWNYWTKVFRRIESEFWAYETVGVDDFTISTPKTPIDHDTYLPFLSYYSAIRNDQHKNTSSDPWYISSHAKILITSLKCVSILLLSAIQPNALEGLTLGFG